MIKTVAYNETAFNKWEKTDAKTKKNGKLQHQMKGQSQFNTVFVPGMMSYMKKSSENNITRTSVNTKANTPANAEKVINTMASNQSLMTPNSTISQNNDDLNQQAFINNLKCKPLTYESTP